MNIDDYHSIVIGEIDNFISCWKEKEDKDTYPEDLPFQDWDEKFRSWQTFRSDYEG